MYLIILYTTLAMFSHLSNAAWNQSTQALEKLVVAYHASQGRARVHTWNTQLSTHALGFYATRSGLRLMFPHLTGLSFLQGVQSLLSSLFKALKVPPPASGWDSMNLMDINYLLALMEDLVCLENTTGQGFLEEAKEREDPFTSTPGSGQLKGKSFLVPCQRKWSSGTRRPSGEIRTLPPSPKSQELQVCTGPQLHSFRK